MRLGIVLAMVFTLTLLVGGCWSRTEIEELAIVTVLGVDKVTVDGRDKWRVAAQVIRPMGMAGTGGQQSGGGGTESKKPEWLVTGIGDTLQDAGRNFSTRSPREIFLAHANLLVIGERAAREGIGDLKDVLMRDPRLRLRMWVMIAEGEALDVLRAEPELENLLANEIREILGKTLPIAGKAAAVDLNHFINYLASPGRDAVATRITTFKPPEMSGIGGGTETRPALEGAEKKAIRLNGAAVFRGDCLAGWLGDRETRGYLFATNQRHTGVIAFQHQGNEVAFVTTHFQTKIKPQIKEGLISFSINIKVDGDIQEHLAAGVPISLEEIREMENVLAGEIQALVTNTVRVAQQGYEADILGLGEHLHRVYPQVWKEIGPNWYSIYPTADVAVNVQVDIRRIGMVSESPATR